MNDCVFCRIASGEIPATIVKRTPEAVAFRDLNPQAPVHVLVIPTQHVDSAAQATGDAGEALLGKTMRLAVEVAHDLGLDGPGYRLVANTGVDGGQSVPHFHLHLLGGRRMDWPPG